MFKRKKEDINEFFKSLRMNIEFRAKEKEIKTIAVVSPESKEGKSTICCKLALSFSKTNKKTLVIDCNLRKPGLQQIFNIKNEAGLLDVLLKEKEIDKAIYKYNSHLDILLSGGIANNNSDFIESESMENLLQSLKEKYDYILLDTPECRSYIDAQILSKKCDGTIIVASIDETQINELIKVKKVLDKVHVNILGVVLNKANNKMNYIY